MSGKSRRTAKNNFKGFTLIEILVAIGIISIVISIAGIAVNMQIARANDLKRKSDLRSLKSSFEMYKLDHGCYPTNSEWNSAQCDSTHSFLSEYIRNKFPCDPGDHTKYSYETTDSGGNSCDGECGVCEGYRLLTALDNKDDSEILALGCDPQYGCGVSGEGNRIPNWGVAVQSSLSVPGFVPGQGQNIGHTDNHDCKHSKDPGCEVPSPTPQNQCTAYSGVIPTPYPTYANVYWSIPPYTYQEYTDLNMIQKGLEWYRVEHGGYPDCGNGGWADAESCLKNKISEYIPQYPSGNTYPYMYIALDGGNNCIYKDFCLAAKPSTGTPHYNFACPVGYPDDTYTVIRGSQGGVIAFKPYYGNVWDYVSDPSERNRRDEIRKNNLQLLKQAFESYKIDNGFYPQITTEILPQDHDQIYSNIYNLDSFKPLLYPKYLASWPTDPGYPSYPYSLFEWNKDGSGKFTKFCMFSFMDDNTNCANQCGVENHMFYYHILSQSACYGISN